MQNNPLQLYSFKTESIIRDFANIGEFLKLPKKEQEEKGLLMRCTELSDCDGDMIYSGHVITFASCFEDVEPKTGLVEYCSDVASFLVRFPDNEIMYLDRVWCSNLAKIKDEILKEIK